MTPTTVAPPFAETPSGLGIPGATPLVHLPADQLALLNRSFALGSRGWGDVHPNPMVGCLIARDGHAVAEGWHDRFGGPHAEVRALEAAGAAARGATAYVSLEPCRHQGKTPACTLALVNAGVARVVYGVADPTRAAGGGGSTLRDAGIEVVGPVYPAEVGRRVNPAFFHAALHHTPWVALKLALSLDGGIAAGPGQRTTITGPEAHAEAHRLRAGFDGILVGSGTVGVDDPLLTVRQGIQPRVAPTRVVVDSRAALAPGAALFRDVTRAPVVVFVARDAPRDAIVRLENAGATVYAVPPGPGGVALDAVLERCGSEGLTSLLCEGGGRLGSALLRAGLVHRLYLFVAPRFLGPGALPAFQGEVAPPGDEGSPWVPAAPPALFGPDVLMVYDREEGEP